LETQSGYVEHDAARSTPERGCQIGGERQSFSRGGRAAQFQFAAEHRLRLVSANLSNFTRPVSLLSSALNTNKQCFASIRDCRKFLLCICYVARRGYHYTLVQRTDLKGTYSLCSGCRQCGSRLDSLYSVISATTAYQLTREIRRRTLGDVRRGFIAYEGGVQRRDSRAR
jgi:hypothetical protein